VTPAPSKAVLGGGDSRGGEVLLTAPAKLTTSLRVLGRRSDGYHLLEAEMVTLDLHDVLVVDPAGDGLSVEPDRAPGALVGEANLTRNRDNLVCRALAAVNRKAAVHLVKRIPVGGGLGGGSADAAAILRWAGCSDPAVAARLGADVPFCVVGGRAHVGGTGERVGPLPFEDRRYVLLVPPFGVDTASVYRAWDELGAGQGRGEPDGANDLTAAALAVEPRLGRWRDVLGEITGCRPTLAGSGATWYVEGTPAELGVEGRGSLVLGHDRGTLIAARTVPRGWEVGTSGARISEA